MKSKDSSQKIQEIFIAAKSIISKKGLDGFNMAALGEESGLGMGTIYNLFPTKEDIVQSLYTDIQQKHTYEIFKEVDFGAAFMISFKQMFHAYFMDRWTNYQDYLFVDQYRVSPYESEDARRIEEEAFAKAYQLLDRGKDELLVKFMDNRFLITYVVGGVKDIIREMKRYDLPLDQQAVSRAFELSAAVILR